MKWRYYVAMWVGAAIEGIAVAICWNSKLALMDAFVGGLLLGASAIMMAVDYQESRS